MLKRVDKYVRNKQNSWFMTYTADMIKIGKVDYMDICLYIFTYKYMYIYSYR